jgi:hypothetical protein
MLTDQWRQACSGGNCVQVRQVGDVIQVRDSNDPEGPSLSFTHAEWDAFVQGAGAGDFNFTETPQHQG